MKAEHLLQRLLDEVQKSTWNAGFSTNTLNFFDDYPEDFAKSNEWWKGKKSDYNDFLKPEFERFIEAVIDILSKFDEGIEKNATKCIGRIHTQHKGRALPYRWAAIHSSGLDRRTDVQFFLNLTSIGLRIGIYSGLNSINTEVWSARYKKIVKNQQEIFNQVKALNNLGYRLTETSIEDHAKGTGGTTYSPSSSEGLTDIVRKNSEIDVLKTFDIRGNSPQEVLGLVVKCFVETRVLYQLLQPSSYSSYARDLI